MKKIIISICLTVIAFGAQAQQTINGEGIADFTSVVLTGDMSVEMIPSDTPRIEMTLNGISPKQILWGVKNSQLSISTQPMKQAEGALIVKIFFRQLETLESNSADVVFQTTLTNRMLTIRAGTGAKITGTVDCLDLMIRLTGSSIAQLSGTSKYLTIDTNQRSKVDARSLEAQSAAVKAQMGSEVYVCGTERLVAETATAASIFYRGEPLLLRSTTKLGGNINSIGK